MGSYKATFSVKRHSENGAGRKLSSQKYAGIENLKQDLS
jgi:hypothetical protein